MNLNDQTTPTVNEELNLKEIINQMLDRWYLFVISVVIFISTGYIYVKTQSPVYESHCSVLIKQEKSAPEEMLLLQDLGLNTGQTNIHNEIGLLKSPDLITKVVKKLGIYTSYRSNRFFKLDNPYLYNGSPIEVLLMGSIADSLYSKVNVVIDKDVDNKYSVKVNHYLQGELHERQFQNVTLPVGLETDIGTVMIKECTNCDNSKYPILATITNPSEVARNIVNDLSIVPSNKQSSLLEMTLKSDNKAKGRDILNAIIDEYNNDAKADQNMVAYNTALFIEERLKDLSAELGEVESEVEAFRKQHDITDIPTQVGAYLTRNENYDSKRIEFETQVNLISFIEEFISDKNNRNRLIPNLGVTDPGLLALIQSYNELIIKRERVERSTTSQNPAFIQINEQVATMFDNIKKSLDNEKRATQIAMQEMDSEYTVTNSRIRNIPTLDKEFTNILRQQEVKSKLFVYLLQKREETNLTQAGVAPKAKIVARPFSAGNPVSPKIPVILVAFLLAGLLFPAAIIWLMDMFQTKIEGMKDLEKLRGISVIGDIAKLDDSEKEADLGVVVVKKDDDSIGTEMFRTLRNNLLYMLGMESNKVVLMTSTIPKEGKTFVSANLAMSLSLMDKKVIVIGCDLRNPQIFSAFGFRTWEKGVSNLLAGLEKDYRPLVHKVNNNLHVLPAGPIPPNPNELLSKPSMALLLDQLKADYDYVVIDSAPIGLVTDTLLITKYADATLYVVRDDYSEKDTVNFINTLVAEGRICNGAIVLNQLRERGKRSKSKYGYGYSYRYKYSYSYSSSDKKARRA